MDRLMLRITESTRKPKIACEKTESSEPVEDSASLSSTAAPSPGSLLANSFALGPTTSIRKRKPMERPPLAAVANVLRYLMA
jgi:hypothetical protein